MDKQVSILITEDEANIALALKNIVGNAISNTKISIATNGLEALECLEKEEFDLLISDWNMPHMTGLELLSKVRATNNTARLPFLMLTARTDVVSVKSALESGVTDYIAKPFDKVKLIEKVTKFLDLSSHTSTTEKEYSGLIDNIVAKLKKDNITFPVLPGMAFKAVEVINSKDASLQDVADLIKVDAGLTSKVISLANSSYYRAAKPFQDLQYAIGRIGLRDSANLILMHTTNGLFNTESPLFEDQQHLLWEHSLATATSARLIGKLVRHPQPECLYAIGMLHDIGKILLIQVLIELATIRDDITKQSIDEALDSLHTMFGVALLKRWGFPANFIDVVQDHHNYDQLRRCSLDTQIISHANLVVSQGDDSLHEANIKRTGKLLGISPEQNDSIRQETIAYVDEMKKMI